MCNSSCRFFYAVLSIFGAIWLIACSGGGNTKRDSATGKNNIIVEAGKPSAQGEKAEARLIARAKAEENAAAKNEENRIAYEEKLERLKTLHQEKLEKFKTKLEAFAKAQEDYKREKQEYDAAIEMNGARLFFNNKSMEKARSRFRDIIGQFPDTRAAKDARILLDDGYVPARATPSRPVPPMPPTEPILVLPPPPEPVAVEYPDEPEEEPRAKVASEKDIPDGDFSTTRNGTYQTPVFLASGKTVYVRGYYRKDGTYVQPHTRSAPGTASTTSSGSRRK